MSEYSNSYTVEKDVLKKAITNVLFWASISIILWSSRIGILFINFLAEFTGFKIFYPLPLPLPTPTPIYKHQHHHHQKCINFLIESFHSKKIIPFWESKWAILNLNEYIWDKLSPSDHSLENMQFHLKVQYHLE